MVTTLLWIVQFLRFWLYELLLLLRGQAKLWSYFLSDGRYNVFIMLFAIVKNYYRLFKMVIYIIIFPKNKILKNNVYLVLESTWTKCATTGCESENFSSWISAFRKQNLSFLPVYLCEFATPVHSPTLHLNLDLSSNGKWFIIWQYICKWCMNAKSIMNKTKISSHFIQTNFLHWFYPFFLIFEDMPRHLFFRRRCLACQYQLHLACLNRSVKVPTCFSFD